MKLSQLYQKYLRGSDLAGLVTVEILDLRLVTVQPHPQEPQVEKWCLFVTGLDPDLPNGILMGPKMVDSLLRVIGNLDVNELKGKRVALKPVQVKVAGKDLVAIRFAKPSPSPDQRPPAEKTQQQPPPQPPEDFPF